MQVILLERIGKLGQMGDTVTVKDGYARNYLLPQGKALRANKANLERFEKERATLETRNLELKSEAESVATKLNDQSFVAIRQASDTGQLYGSVSTRDIADIITEAGYTVGRNQVQLDRPIKILGIHPLRVSLHPEVNVTVSVNVARTEEEAERQARGEDITEQDDDDTEEETISAEDVFEDKDLAKQAEETLEADADGEEAEASAEETTEASAEAETEDASEDDEKKDD